MEAIFTALRILEKIDQGQLTSEPADIVSAKAIIGGRSIIYKHAREDGTPVATTHVLMDAHGEVRHRHGKDILLGSVRFRSAGEPQRPLGSQE